MERRVDMTRRRSGWDYCAAADYMVTLAMADRSRCWLGKVVSTGKPAGAMQGRGRMAPGVALTPLGEAVAEKWLELPSLFPGIELREYVVMPEHFHGIIRVLQRQEHPLGQIVGAFKARSTGAARRLAESASKLADTMEGGDRISATLAGTMEGGAASEASGHIMVPASLLAGKSLWTDGLCDSILWGRERYEAAAAYIAENPYRLAARLANPQLFAVRRDISISLDIGGALEAHFAGVGNDELLHRVDFHQVQCSRRYFAYSRDAYGRLQKNAPPSVATAEFRERLDAALSAAKDGAVLVNPCISQGEKEIARRAFVAGADMVVLKNQGFSPSFKPEGGLYAACDAGRLLLLAPAAWPFRGGEQPITREAACTLNRLAQAISRDGAISIDYKGREPRFIDDDARRAVTI